MGWEEICDKILKDLLEDVYEKNGLLDNRTIDIINDNQRREVRISEIIKKYGGKILLSGSWRDRYLKKFPNFQKHFQSLFYKLF